jgi:hypothetical protein
MSNPEFMLIRLTPTDIALIALSIGVSILFGSIAHDMGSEDDDGNQK